MTKKLSVLVLVCACFFGGASKADDSLECPKILPKAVIEHIKNNGAGDQFVIQASKIKWKISQAHFDLLKASQYFDFMSEYRNNAIELTSQSGSTCSYEIKPKSDSSSVTVGLKIDVIP